MSLQAEGGDGDQDEEQRCKSNKLQEKKIDKEKNVCYCQSIPDISGFFNHGVLYTGICTYNAKINELIYSWEGEWTQTSLITLHQFEWTPERGAIYQQEQQTNTQFPCDPGGNVAWECRCSQI